MNYQGFDWSGRAARVMLAVSLTVCAASASAGLFEDEEARRAILDLRQKIEALKVESAQKIAEEVRRASDESAQSQRSLLDLQNQLEALRGELAKVRGQDEQTTRDVADLQRRQKDATQSLDERLRKLEPIRVAVDGRDFMVETSEKRDYEAALGVFRKGEFATAQQVFVAFLNRYATTGYRTSSLFWLGNAQYATKDYKEALASFRALIAHDAEHVRVPESVLAIANCQIEMKDTKAARKTLEELIANYPTSEAAVAAKDRLARFK